MKLATSEAVRKLFILYLFVTASAFAQASGSPYRKDFEKEPNGPHGNCYADWTKLAGGLAFRTIDCLGDRGDLDLNVVRIDLGHYTLDSVIEPHGSARGVVTSHDADFAINANFFDAGSRPIGVVASGGEIVRDVKPSSWQSVFLITTDGSAKIIMPSQWKAYQKRVWMAVQAGPRLVAGGHTSHVRESYAAARAGVCIQKNGSLLFFATPQTRKFGMGEIARVARRGENDGGLECRDAMLFDGGHSTQIFAQGEKKRVSVAGDPVPVFVYATKKSASATTDGSSSSPR